MELAGDALEKERTPSVKDDALHTKPCPFPYLLKAPKSDMRKAYEFRMQNQGCFGPKCKFEERPHNAEQYKARKDIYTLISLPV